MEHLLMFPVIFLYLQQGLANEDMCGYTRHVSSKVGGEVVLPVQQTEVQDITWMTDREKNVFAVTEAGKPVTVRSLFYNGRLNVTANGSLVITKLTRGDERIYKGSVLRRASGQCAQLYNLTVLDERPVEQVYVFTDITSTSTSPVRTTAGAKTTMFSKQVPAWLIISLSVSATAVLMLIFIVTFLLSTFQNIKERKKAGARCKEDGMLYTELDKKCLQKVPSAINEENLTTVTYSSVKAAKTNV